MSCDSDKWSDIHHDSCGILWLSSEKGDDRCTPQGRSKYVYALSYHVDNQNTLVYLKLCRYTPVCTCTVSASVSTAWTEEVLHPPCHCWTDILEVQNLFVSLFPTPNFWQVRCMPIHMVYNKCTGHTSTIY